MKKAIRRIILLFAAFLLIISAAGSVQVSASVITPKKVTVTSVTSSAYNKVTIRWKKTKGCDRYVIYYRKAGTSKWIRIKKVQGSTTSFTHASSKKCPIVVGQKYQYRVRGYNSTTKKYGKASNIKTVKTTPNKVKLLSATVNAKNTKVTVKWAKARGCNYYRIYRKVSGSGYKLIAKVSASKLSYVDRNPVQGKKNTYTVRGCYSKTKTVSLKYNKKGLSVIVKSGHTHIWVAVYKTVHYEAQYKTVHHDAAGHNEQVLVTAAWDEEVITGQVKHSICGNCGKYMDEYSQSQIDQHMEEHALSGEDEGWYTKTENIIQTIHHDAVYKTTWVEDTAAYDEKVLVKAAYDKKVRTGYKCSGCGAVK